MRVMWDAAVVWLNQNSGAVQGAVGLVLLFTLFAVLWYALETWKVRLEMQKQRFDSLMPIIDLMLVPLATLVKRDSINRVSESLGQRRTGESRNGVAAEVSNIGVGPALEVEVSFSHPSQAFETYKVGTLQRESQPISISLKLKEEVNASLRSPTPAGHSMSATYMDVYGHQWQSKRELISVLGQEFKLGHLVITPLQGHP